MNLRKPLIEQEQAKLYIVKNLIILGSAGQGITTASAILDLNRKKRQWNLLGYLDDDPKKQGLSFHGFSVLGTTDKVREYPDAYFLVPLGNPCNYFVRKKVVHRLNIPEERFATIIHPDATVSENTRIGRGTIIMPGVRIMPNVIIGNHVLILENTVLSHDVVVKDFTTITNSVSIAGEVTINEGCYLGANSSIRERIKLGEWSLIGMGAVVVRNVLPYTVMVGNPARILKKLEPADFLIT